MVENTTVMENETYRFIALIEKHPQLYNKKHKDFLRQDIRNTIWENICKDMNWEGKRCGRFDVHFARAIAEIEPLFPSEMIDANKAKKKWRNLRDKFVKKRRRHGNGANLSEDEGQREFYSSLMFLDGHVNSRK